MPAVLPLIFIFRLHTVFIQKKLTNGLTENLPTLLVEVASAVQMTTEDALLKVKQDHPYAKPEEMCIPQSAKDQINKLAKEKKALQQKKRVLSTKLSSSHEVIGNIREKKLVSDESAEVLKSVFPNLKFQLHTDGREKSDGEYATEMKQFAIYLYYCSTKAYEFCRKSISLPSTRTVRRWLATSGCYPGFTPESLDAITEKHSTSDHETFVCLMLDGMSIRQQVEFDGSHYVG